MKRWIFRAVVSAAVVTILLALIPIRDVLDALRRVHVLTWAVSVAIFFAGHYLNAVKLHLLLGSVPGLLTSCVKAQYAGLVANLSLPGLAGGDLVRAAYLAPTTGTKRVAFASIADRLIDTSTLVLLIAVALPLAGIPAAIAPVLQKAAMWLAAGATLFALLALVLIRQRRFAALSASIREAWHSAMTRPGSVAAAVSISLGVQSAFVMTNVWLAREVGVVTSLAAWFVAWPLSKLVAILPISLGGIGVREAVLVSLLSPYGAQAEAVLASGFLWQAVLIVTGLIGLTLTHMLPGRSPVAGPTTAR